MQTELPFTGLQQPFGVAVDSAGNVYVADTANNRVLKLVAGSTTQTVLPFTRITPTVGLHMEANPTLWRWIAPATCTSSIQRRQETLLINAFITIRC